MSYPKSPPARRRDELLVQLNNATNNYFYYIFTLTQTGNPYENYHKYPNYMLEKWVQELNYTGSMEGEDNYDVKRLYTEFCNEYAYCLQAIQEEQIQQQYYLQQLQLHQAQPISFDDYDANHSFTSYSDE